MKKKKQQPQTWKDLYQSIIDDDDDDDLVAVKRERDDDNDDTDVIKKVKVKEEENNELNRSEAKLADFTEDLKLEEDATFLRKLKSLNVASQKFTNTLPDLTDCLRYMDTLAAASLPVWFENGASSLARNGFDYPNFISLKREYLQHFLRAPKDDTERECGHPNCISLQLGGFKCRELLLPSDKDKPVNRMWCYMDHMNETTRLYWECRSPAQKKTIKLKKPFAIHYFVVEVDKIGEYRLEKTIPNDSDVHGIYGPFPLFNAHNYVKYEVELGVWGWRESDQLVFRQAQKASQPSKFSPTTEPPKGKRSTQFGPTGPQRPSFN